MNIVTRSFLAFVTAIWLILTFSWMGLPEASAFERTPFSELAGFSREWCAPNSEALRGAEARVALQIVEVCFGETRFFGQPVRALEMILEDGAKPVFVESDFLSIDLLHLRIELIGPISSFHSPIAAGLTGQAHLFLNGRGEVIAMEGRLGLAQPFNIRR